MMYLQMNVLDLLKLLQPERKINISSVGTSFIPTVSFRRKANFPVSGRANSISVKVEGVDIVTTSDLIYEIRIGSSLVGASFGTPTNTQASQTALESDTSATTINTSTGNLIFSGLASGGARNGNALATSNQLSMELPDNSIITLAVAALSGNTTVSVVMRMKEEW